MGLGLEGEGGLLHGRVADVVEGEHTAHVEHLG